MRLKGLGPGPHRTLLPAHHTMKWVDTNHFKTQPRVMSMLSLLFPGLFKSKHGSFNSANSLSRFKKHDSRSCSRRWLKEAEDRLRNRPTEVKEHKSTNRPGLRVSENVLRTHEAPHGLTPQNMEKCLFLGHSDSNSSCAKAT